MAKEKPNLNEEKQFWETKAAFVFGVDEAGRGCLAGPVYSAVFAFPKNTSFESIPSEIRDSKQITEKNREKIFELVKESALFFGIGSANAQEVDEWNILRATHLSVARAMEQALAAMDASTVGDAVGADEISFLADGNRGLLGPSKFFLQSHAHEFPLLKKLFAKGFVEKAIVKGDTKVASIGAASILAKVSRDRYMRELAERDPRYDFDVHKGYGTERHLLKLKQYGASSEHRISYAPVAKAIQEWNKVQKVQSEFSL